ncbi:EcsC family protein [Robertkochia solimangrovi]|uniref:EcsC family protein n=1 Tax=Robertkochia solimangrovi TaxID=2213046 RepID=UPI00117DFDF6|nr:EcsC family protein [Robertkochia solimangrovi]TRZ42269.1 EcsC family protein [Robertkochia solimangrovi]
MLERPVVNTGLKTEDTIALARAKHQMENISGVMRTLNKIGSTIEFGLSKLPESKQAWLNAQVHKALMFVLKSNLKTMKKGQEFRKPSDNTYRALVTTSGVLGGVFGPAAFAADLTIATKFMMRSIIDIARSEGEDIYDPETQLSCLEVFALGGRSPDDDGLETGYYATRLALNAGIRQAADFVAKNGISEIGKLLISSTNPLVKVVAIIASRFSVQVSEKFMAQAVPVAGAVGGGTVNFVFIQHFQKMARAHFVIRRLERSYGFETVKKAYELV